MRYCIIAGPRSGSTWLEFLLVEHLKHINLKPIRLGEFLHPHVAKNEQFILTANNNIAYGKYQWSTDKEIFDGRLSMILNNTKQQSLTMRLFPQNYFFEFIDYVDVVNKLKSCDFKFISLHRNILSRALSWAVMDQSKIIHLFNDNTQYHTTFQGKKEKTLIEPFEVCLKNFTRILLMSVQDDIYRRIINDIVHCDEVDYDNLENELRALDITIHPTHIEPVHEMKYDKLITNYDKLLDIYNKLKNTI